MSTTTFGTFGAPPDAAAWIALVIAISLLALGCSSRVSHAATRRPWVCVCLLSMAAAFLSAGYVAYYLRGGPRIIDATSYFLEARAFSAKNFVFSVPPPSGSFRGRFLLSAGSPESLGVIFPPGYPLLLAAGFLLRVPMAVGPAIGAGLVVATFLLARRLFDDKTALLASALSVTSAALRYHTADTMSHGCAALLGTTALAAALSPGARASLGAGLACGWLIATRPVTGLVYAIATGVLCRSPRRVGAWFLGLLPGFALILMHQRALTGQWFESTQLAYYALADGPPGCFRFGFGSSIGCLGEHGDFVRHNLPHGYGFLAAAGTTLRRLKMHLLDAGNCEPFALALVAAGFVGRNRPQVRLLLLLVLGVMVAYVPFYFDGNYPGGGARFFADALPLEHVLLAWLALCYRVERFVLPLALTGFATHAVFEHRQLRDREGGRPMYEASVLEEYGVRRGIVFVDTDHGFNLGHAPGVDVREGVVVARLLRDGHDSALFESLGRPPAYIYRFSAAGAAKPSLEPYVPRSSLRFELEGEWPPLEVEGGWVRREYASCASGGAGILIERVGLSAAATIEVAVRKSGLYAMTVGWLGHAPEGAYLRLGSEHHRVLLNPRPAEAGCGRSTTFPVALRSGSQRIRVHVPPRAPAVDFVELKPAGTEASVIGRPEKR